MLNFYDGINHKFYNFFLGVENHKFELFFIIKLAKRCYNTINFTKSKSKPE